MNIGEVIIFKGFYRVLYSFKKPEHYCEKDDAHDDP